MTASTDPDFTTQPNDSATWTTDILGDDFSSLSIPLGDDPDGEGPIDAVLVRHEPAQLSTADAVLYVHGFTDYFFQRELAEFFAAHHHRFYAIDLRKCGRALHAGQTPHYTRDLDDYRLELTRALDVIAAESHTRVLVVAHSTGGLITPLWIDHLRRTDPARHALIGGLVLNSPWFDLQGPAVLRTPVVSGVIDLMARVDGKRVIPQGLDQSYGASLHTSTGGEWDYDLDKKPLGGFPVTFGFLSAVRRGHARLHKGLDIGVPSLVLRSQRSSAAAPETVDETDVVLDVRQIARWSGCLGGRGNVVPVPGARHDVFLSRSPARERAYTELAQWLQLYAEPGTAPDA
ncbi:alpha/beta hydrolase [Gordonia jinhuaensis]|uniref:alpha/beta hydrolase n=1 Tax=Gordonia jinhuaensis TaxID=1517702 RepID=UPI0035716DE2